MTTEQLPSRKALDLENEAGSKIRDLVLSTVEEVENFPTTPFFINGEIVQQSGICVEYVLGEDSKQKEIVVLSPEGIERHNVHTCVDPISTNLIHIPDTRYGNTGLRDYVIYGQKALAQLETVLRARAEQRT